MNCTYSTMQKNGRFHPSRLPHELAAPPCLDMGLSIQALAIGMKVRHPHHGVGTVKALTEHTAEIVFDDTQRTIAPESSELSVAEPVAQLSELQVPLDALIRQTTQAVVEALGLEKSHSIVEG